MVPKFNKILLKKKKLKIIFQLDQKVFYSPSLTPKLCTPYTPKRVVCICIQNVGP